MKFADKIVSRIELYIFLFAIGFILFQWPFLSSPILSNLEILFKYLFIVWGIIIFIIFLIARCLALYYSRNPDNEKGQP